MDWNFTSTTENYVNMGENCTRSKNAFLDFMLKKGYIDAETHTNLTRNYTIEIKKPSQINSFWKKIIGKNDDGEEAYRFVIMKQESFEYDDSKEPVMDEPEEETENNEEQTD